MTKTLLSPPTLTPRRTPASLFPQVLLQEIASDVGGERWFGCLFAVPSALILNFTIEKVKFEAHFIMFFLSAICLKILVFIVRFPACNSFAKQNMQGSHGGGISFMMAKGLAAFTLQAVNSVECKRRVSI